MDWSSPSSSVHEIPQATMLEGLSFPSPGDLPNPGIEPRSPTMQANPLRSEPPGNTSYTIENPPIPQSRSFFSLSLVIKHPTPPHSANAPLPQWGQVSHSPATGIVAGCSHLPPCLPAGGGRPLLCSLPINAPRTGVFLPPGQGVALVLQLPPLVTGAGRG